MTLTNKKQNLPLMDAKNLEKLARRRGECVTVLLPATHPGAPEKDKLETLKVLMHAEGAAVDPAMVQKMEEALVEREISGGGPGVAIFAGEDFLEVYGAPVTTAKVVIGEQFFVLPTLLDACLAQEFMILGLSKKVLRLLQFEEGICRAIELPEGMPAKLEDSQGVESSDLKTKNHASSGSMPGGAGAVHFGTTSQNEDSDNHLEHWFGQVDQGLAPIVGKRQLMLLGPDFEVAAFRRVVKHCTLFEGEIVQGMKDLSMGEIAQMAGERALSAQNAKGVAALEKIREWKVRSAVATDGETANAAAKEGRVQVLCVSDSVVEEDLVNATVIETLSHGGQVMSVREKEMSPGSSVAALLRY